MLEMLHRLSLCLLNRHKPIRDRVKPESGGYIGTCRYCGANIRRKERGWWIRDSRPRG